MTYEMNAEIADNAHGSLAREIEENGATLHVLGAIVRLKKMMLSFYAANFRGEDRLAFMTKEAKK
jgi:hypothetical protein